MKSFGFLSFGHYTLNPQQVGPHSPDARGMLHDAIELAEAAEEIGVNGAYFRVHHFLPQAASPIPLLSAIAARTSRIEVGTGVIDMRYENPLHFAEEAAALDLIANSRVALGVSRGSPEPTLKGWESFGYHAQADNGEDLARTHFTDFMRAIRGEGIATAAPLDIQYPRMYRPGTTVPVLPHSPQLDRRIWWGAASHSSAKRAAEDGVNLMSSTLVLETGTEPFSEIQAQQIDTYRQAWKEAGHEWTPRVSVSRSIFPIVNDEDRLMFGTSGEGSDQVGYLDGGQATFGRTYADEPDKLIEQLTQDRAVMEADTLMLTIPSQLGVEINTRILQNFAEHVAPALGWEPNQKGPATGYEISQ